jgi:hypothetical protein
MLSTGLICLVVSPYFRFDPGAVVGSIGLDEVSAFPSIDMLVQNHIRDNSPIEAQFKACADTIRAASFFAYEALPVADISIPPLVLRPLVVQNENRTDREWLSIPELVDSVVDDLGTLSNYLTLTPG